MSNTTITYLVGGGCGAVVLIAFCVLLLGPAITAYRTPLQRLGAAVLSFYVLGALMGLGVLLGALIIYEWPRFFG
jgi:hypothetical protein